MNSSEIVRVVTDLRAEGDGVEQYPSLFHHHHLLPSSEWLSIHRWVSLFICRSCAFPGEFSVENGEEEEIGDGEGSGEDGWYEVEMGMWVMWGEVGGWFQQLRRRKIWEWWWWWA
ncbi:unnamed protein product [Camellia sinensis]